MKENKALKSMLDNIKKEVVNEKKAEMKAKTEADKSSEMSNEYELKSYEKKARRLKNSMLKDDMFFDFGNMKYEDIKMFFLFMMKNDRNTDDFKINYRYNLFGLLANTYSQFYKNIDNIKWNEHKNHIYDFSLVWDWLENLFAMTMKNAEKGDLQLDRTMNKLKLYVEKVYDDFVIHRFEKIYKKKYRPAVIRDNTYSGIITRQYSFNLPYYIDSNESYMCFADSYIEMSALILEKFVIRTSVMLHSRINIHDFLSKIDEVLDIINLGAENIVKQNNINQHLVSSYKDKFNLSYLANTHDHYEYKKYIFGEEKKIDNIIVKEIEDDKKKPEEKQLYNSSPKLYTEKIPDNSNLDDLKKYIELGKNISGTGKTVLRKKINLLKSDWGDRATDLNLVVFSYRAVFISNAIYNERSAKTIYKKLKEDIGINEEVKRALLYFDLYYLRRLFDREHFQNMGQIDEYKTYIAIRQKYKDILLKLYYIYYDKSIIHSVYDVSYSLVEGMSFIFECLFTTPNEASDWQRYKTALKDYVLKLGITVLTFPNYKLS